ncbi:MAG: PhnA domain-containing protein [Halocynthiibacter sp.]
MTLLNDLSTRAQACEICGATEALDALEIGPNADGTADMAILASPNCAAVSDPTAPHWKGLSDAIWSPVAPVQVHAYRLLHQLQSEAWARDLLEIAYLEPETLAWAEAGIEAADEESVVHRDSNGVTLTVGDSVVLIKDLPVKGAGFTAKRGTPVRNISLVPDTPEHIEGRVNGQQIVILTKFVKKTS